MKLSQKIQEMELSPIRKFVPYADQARAAGKKVYGLNIGQPDIKTPRAFFDAVQNFDQEVLAYANSRRNYWNIYTGFYNCLHHFKTQKSHYKP